MKTESLKSLSRHSRRKAAAFLFAAVLSACPFSSLALNQSYYTPTSKLSKGKWVKIKAEGQGIHQITYEQLREWGFSNPEKVYVYGYGATLLSDDSFNSNHPDDVKLTYSHHQDNKIFFYSTDQVRVMPTSEQYLTIERNYYSTSAYYLLGDRDVDPSELPQNSRLLASLPAVNAHLSVSFQEDELQNPSVGGAYFLGKDISFSDGIQLPVDVKNMGTGNSSWKTSTFRVSYAVLNNRNTQLAVTPPDGVTLATYNEGSGASYQFEEHVCYRMGLTYLTFNDMLQDGRHNFTGICRLTPDFAAVDYTWLMYPRLSKMSGDNQITMFFPGVKTSQNFSIDGPSTLRVVNITSPSAVFEHNTTVKDNAVVGTFDRNYNTSLLPTCALVAYDTALPQPGVEFVENVANQNFHAMETPDMLIITTSDLMNAAEELAQIHRDLDGMDVEVVRHDLLFNEFSSATPDIMGYRRFIKMLYDRDPEKLKYVIMYGPSHWDNRNIISSKRDRLLIYEVIDPNYSGVSTSSYGSDSYLGMLNDNFSSSSILSTPQTIAVGRISVTNDPAARAVNRKIRNYIENPPSPAVFNTSLVMSDDGDGNEHLEQAEALAKILENGREASTVVRAHNSIYQWNQNDAQNLRSVAIDALNRGTGLFVYIGHGDNVRFGAETLWSLLYAERTSYDIHPVAFWGTCDPYGFDLENNNIGETVLHKEDGGVINLIAPGRVVFGPRNYVLGQSLMNSYVNATPGTTTGQLWLNARNNLLGTSGYTSDYQVNTMCYNLGGDPALRLPVPEYRVQASTVVESDDETAPVKSMVEALKPTHIEGRIVDSYGQPVEDFNGTVTLQIYDAPYDVNVLVRTSKDNARTLQLDQDLLVSKTVDVTDGKFETTFVAPVPVHESDQPNRMIFSAMSDDDKGADGLLKEFSVRASNDANPETTGEAPAITSLYVHHNGSQSDRFTTAQTIRLAAEGSVDIVGLNNSSAPGAGSSLSVDGVQVSGAKETIRANDDGRWTMSIALTGLSEGTHTALLTIADNAGRRTSEMLSFTVMAADAVELIADVETVRDAVTFDVEHSLGDVSTARLVIEDLTGKTVISRNDVSFPCRIDMKQEGLANGNYNAYVQLVGSAGRGSSSRLPLVYIRK